MKAYNIDWVINIEEAYDKLDDMNYKKAASVIEVPADTYANMTTEERHEYAYDFFRHCPGALDNFIGLPSEIEIPEETVQKIAESHPNYGSYQTCKHYSKCNTCSDCQEGSKYEFDLHYIDDQYITEWLSEEYGYSTDTYQLDVDPLTGERY